MFIDEEQLTSLEDKMNKRGFLEGSEMATTFNMLRANDLIWSFVVNNYLLGNDPFPFDLLYWNADSTRMPARMHSFYLRKMYQENLLAQPGGITLVGRADRPAQDQDAGLFPVDARGPHRAVEIHLQGTQLLGGPKRFVLAASGHIAGVVNPPEGGKYATGSTRRCHPTRTTGSRVRPRSPARGGPTGTAGCQRRPRNTCPRACPATAI